MTLMVRFTGLTAGETAQDTFRYTVKDGSGATSTATVTITITGENDAPVAKDITGAVMEHGPATTVAASYIDPDNGDTRSFTVDVATNATKGTVVNNGDGTFSYDPHGAFIGLKAGETRAGYVPLYRDGRLRCDRDRDGDDHHHGRERCAGGGGRRGSRDGAWTRNHGHGFCTPNSISATAIPLRSIPPRTGPEVMSPATVTVHLHL